MIGQLSLTLLLPQIVVSGFITGAYQVLLHWYVHDVMVLYNKQDDSRCCFVLRNVGRVEMGH